jgi:hypothetical protein
MNPHGVRDDNTDSDDGPPHGRYVHYQVIILPHLSILATLYQGLPSSSWFALMSLFEKGSSRLGGQVVRQDAGGGRRAGAQKGTCNSGNYHGTVVNPEVGVGGTVRHVRQRQVMHRRQQRQVNDDSLASDKRRKVVISTGKATRNL